MADFDNPESILTNDHHDHRDHHQVSTFSEKDRKVFVDRNQNVVPLHRQMRTERCRRTRKKYFSRALGKSSTCGRKNEVRMATTRVK